MDIWEALGVAEPILATGIPWSGDRSFHRGRTIVEFSMPVDPVVRHAPMRNVAQCTVEEILVAQSSGQAWSISAGSSGSKGSSSSDDRAADVSPSCR
jgi:hypothetical protein